MRFLYLILSVLVCTLGCSEKKEMAKTYSLFVGTYTDGASEGIYKFTFDAATGNLTDKALAAALPNPSFLKISKDKNNIYAVQETADFDSLGGGVTAFKLKDGLLELQNSMGTGGAHPCHVSLSGKGQLAVSNYTGGNFAIFSLGADGELGTSRQILDHKVLDTAKTAHAHMAQFRRGGLFTSDLGLDAIKRYQLQGGEYVPAPQASIDQPNGSGPRHFVFGKEDKMLYVINELNATITVLERDYRGEYHDIQTVETLASDYEGERACADIHLSEDGRFLYGSNRGENTIVIFTVDRNTGELMLVGREGVQGDWPRNFTIDPSGNFLLVANQRSDNITVFKRDAEQGTLEFLNEIALPSPVCLEFLN